MSDVIKKHVIDRIISGICLKHHETNNPSLYCYIVVSDISISCGFWDKYILNTCSKTQRCYAYNIYVSIPLLKPSKLKLQKHVIHFRIQDVCLILALAALLLTFFSTYVFQVK